MNNSKPLKINSLGRKAGILVFLFTSFSLNLKSQNAFYIKFGGIFGTSISTTTELNSPLPNIVEDKYGPVLGLSLGLSYLFEQFEIEVETQMRNQNWFYDLNTPLASVNLNFGLNTLPGRKLQPILFSGVGYYYYLPAADVLQSTLTIYEDASVTSIILKQDFSNSYKTIPINFDAGVRLIWQVGPSGTFLFTLKYNFGWSPYLFYTANSNLVYSGSGKSIQRGIIRAQYDGSALLFSVSYGLKLTGLRKRLKESLRQ